MDISRIVSSGGISHVAGSLVMLVLLIVLLIPFFLWIIELADVFIRRFDSPLLKAFWLTIVLCLPIAGALIYSFIKPRYGYLPREVVRF